MKVSRLFSTLICGEKLDIFRKTQGSPSSYARTKVTKFELVRFKEPDVVEFEDMNMKRGNQKISISNQRGQALLEYVLLAVGIIIILVGLLGRFFKPMGNFASGPVKDYLECILERGELPALGGNPSAECTLEGPRTAGDGSGGSGRGGGKGSDLSKGDGGNKSDKDSKKSGEDGGSAGGGSSANSGGGGRNGGSSRMFSKPRPNSISEGSSSRKIANSDRDDDGEGDVQLQGNLQIRGSQGRVRRIAAKGYAGVLAQEVEKAKKKENKVRILGKITKKDIEQGLEGEKKRLLVKNTLHTKKADEQQTEEMNIGKFIRVILIILLVLGFLIFIGMQLNKLSKEWDSNKTE